MKRVLILKNQSGQFMTKENEERLRKKVVEQLRGGIVLLPQGFDFAISEFRDDDTLGVEVTL